MTNTVNRLYKKSDRRKRVAWLENSKRGKGLMRQARWFYQHRVCRPEQWSSIPLTVRTDVAGW